MNSAWESNGECYTENMPDVIISLSAGFFGAVGFGALSLALASLAWRRGATLFQAAGPKLLVLIPAHNEERTLPSTLQSIREAATAAGISVRIVIGADSCSDLTAAIALAGGADVVTFECRSKWKVLCELAKQAKPGEWAALVDAGALWPKEILHELSPHFANRSLMGIAPAYFPREASLVERNLWAIEATWKGWENRAGGPVSAHGATIFFRGEVLLAAFAYLKIFNFHSWLNDDVALPLAARILYPNARFHYWYPKNPLLCIADSGLRERSAQFGRRQRMVVGNFQWMIALWPRSLFCSPAAGLLAIRRIARIFWAYWGLCLIYAFSFFIFQERWGALLAAASVALFLTMVLWFTGKRGIVGAALASLLAPLFFPLAFSIRAHRWS